MPLTKQSHLLVRTFTRILFLIKSCILIPNSPTMHISSYRLGIRSSFFVLGILLLQACKEPVLPDTITIGVTDDMEVFYHSSILVSDLQNNDKSFYLDVNDDGVNDLRIRHRSAPSTYFGITKELSFIPLHSKMKLLSEESMDSVYLTSGTQTLINTAGDSIHIIANTYSCVKTNASSFYETKAENWLIPKQKGDKLSANESFHSSNCVVIEMDSSSYYPTGGYFGNAEVFIFEKYKNACSEFPNSNNQYVGFRLDNQKDASFLGWIRLSIGQSGIVINRHAIQTLP